MTANLKVDNVVNEFFKGISIDNESLEFIERVESYNVEFVVRMKIQINVNVDKGTDSSTTRKFESEDEYNTYKKELHNPEKYKKYNNVVSGTRKTNFGSFHRVMELQERETVKVEKNCLSCSGLGENACPVCDGNKVITCKACQGDGCKECRGLGKFQCGNCELTGTITCAQCKGQKKVLDVELIWVDGLIEYEFIFNHGTNEKIRKSLEMLDDISKLQTKNIALINSNSELSVVDGRLIIDYFMFCPFHVAQINLKSFKDEIIIYGISEYLIDINNITEKMLTFSEDVIINQINATTLINGNTEELFAAMGDYVNIPVHKKIFTIISTLIKRDMPVNVESIYDESDKLLSKDYIENLMSNVKSSKEIGSTVIKLKFLIPVLIISPFVYNLINAFLNKNLSIVTILLLIGMSYMYTGYIVNKSISKYVDVNFE